MCRQIGDEVQARFFAKAFSHFSNSHLRWLASLITLDSVDIIECNQITLKQLMIFCIGVRRIKGIWFEWKILRSYCTKHCNNVGTVIEASHLAGRSKDIAKVVALEAEIVN